MCNERSEAKQHERRLRRLLQHPRRHRHGAAAMIPYARDLSVPVTKRVAVLIAAVMLLAVAPSIAQAVEPVRARVIKATCDNPSFRFRITNDTDYAKRASVILWHGYGEDDHLIFHTRVPAHGSARGSVSPDWSGKRKFYEVDVFRGRVFNAIGTVRWRAHLAHNQANLSECTGPGF
jgi:hypothetical protein